MTPTPNTSAEAGVSYEAENGLTASIFDSFQGRQPGYDATLNPAPQSLHRVDAHLRFDLARHFRTPTSRGLALFAHANNLANSSIWLPDWGGNSGDTIPVDRGRTIYFGIEVSLRRD